jgi:hypothetical protein
LSPFVIPLPAQIGWLAAAVPKQEGAEFGYASLALPGVTKMTGLVRRSMSMNTGDVLMAALGRGFVEADRAYPPQVERGNNKMNIVPNDAPRPLVGDADERAAASTGISRTRTIAACSNNSVNHLPGRAGTPTHLIP